jgi:BA14K-like protein
LRIVCAVMLMAAAFPLAAQASGAARGSAHVNGARFGGVAFGGARFHTAPIGARYYGGIYRRVGGGWQGGIYRGGVYRDGGWPGRYAYYGDWRRSYSPYWGWGVAAGLLATAPAYYYYGVGFGDAYGFEAPVYESAVAFCMWRFRSYDPASGTYVGGDGFPHPCP